MASAVLGLTSIYRNIRRKTELLLETIPEEKEQLSENVPSKLLTANRAVLGHIPEPITDKKGGFGES